MQKVYIAIVLLGLLLAALFGGDGIHGAEVHRVWLPMVETSVDFSSVGPVIIGGQHGARHLPPRGGKSK